MLDIVSSINIETIINDAVTLSVFVIVCSLIVSVVYMISRLIFPPLGGSDD